MPLKIPLGGERGHGQYAVVDFADWSEVEPYSWVLGNHGYVCARINGKVLLMHRFLMGLTSHVVQTDHINRNRLDNRRVNMRVSDQQKNKQNVPGRGGTSDYRGVSWSAVAQKWTARYGHTHVGLFTDEYEAAVAIAQWRKDNLPHTREELV